MGISATARETSRLRAVLVAKLQPVLFRSSQSRRGYVSTATCATSSSSSPMMGRSGHGLYVLMYCAGSC